MDIQSATFLSSYPRESGCPKGNTPEFAFIGRSNVGKSSLINMLTGKKGLAKVSQTPGKTQLINFFHINEKWHLVDLPGYGYAKLSKYKQKELSTLISGYFRNRMELTCAFVLIDINVPPTKNDLLFLNQMGEWEVPFALIFTKCDKISKTAIEKGVAAFKEAMSAFWEELPPYFITSAEHRTGRESVLEYIGTLI